jgi:hypothetical protein
MSAIVTRPLPPESLLAGHAKADDYTDCFTVDLPRAVTLSDFIAAFYNSPAFRPERWVLHLIGKGSNADDVRKLAASEVSNFAAWNLVSRNETEILLQDFHNRTCSWLCVEPLATTAPTIKGHTRLYFGSCVRQPDGALVKALMPFHRWYAKALLGSAVRALK